VAPKDEFKPKSNSKSVMNAPKGGKVRVAAASPTAAAGAANTAAAAGAANTAAAAI
jgi:hypothetical protein